MDEEEKKVEKGHSRKKRIKHLRFFKKRKKSELRPFVEQKKNRRLKKTLGILSLVILALFILIAILIGIRYAFEVYKGAISSKEIVAGNVTMPESNEELAALFLEDGITIEKLQSSSFSAKLTVQVTNGPKVILSRSKDLKVQVQLLDSILRRLIIEDKKPTVIDLRYNKPIVKF